MLIDNVKYACEACIRGHRVSSCHHNDRPLHKVAPKGRPVSQCQHCRGLRKARAQHVQCDCANKGHHKTDCHHDKNEHKSEPSGDVGQASLSDLHPADSNSCCCSHGSRCTCSLKKDHGHLDPVPEDLVCMLQAEAHDIRPRSATSTPSEGRMTVFANGHHKPVHKHNDAAHTRGLPYIIPPHLSISEMAQRSVDSLPHTKRSLVSHETPSHHDSITSAPQPVRRVKSEHGSPDLTVSDGKLAPVRPAIPLLDTNDSSPYGVFSGTNSPTVPNEYPLTAPDQLQESYFGYQSSNRDFETPLHSAGLNSPAVDWNSFDLQYDPNGQYVAAPSQPPSYASFEPTHLTQPGLTSSSGELSETEDFPNLPEARPTVTLTPGASSSVTPSNELETTREPDFGNIDSDTYRLSSASSFMGLPQQSNTMNMLGQENLGNMDIDDFIRKAEEETRELQARRRNTSSISKPTNGVLTPPTSINAQADTPPVHGLTVREAQSYAHMGESPKDASNDDMAKQREECIRQISNASGEDPMWSNPSIGSPEDVDWDGEDDRRWRSGDVASPEKDF